MKKIILNGFVALTSLFATTNVFSQAFTEDFDDINTLTTNGWYIENTGTTIGTIPSWIQGNPSNFPAYNGATNSYIGGHYSTITGNGTISLWLVTPNRTFRNGDVITFRARAADDGWADRLQVRMSLNGTSTNVGSNPTTVGDFSTLLLDNNPNQYNNVFTDNWTLYTITISDLPAPTSGRIAFRYYVTSGGPEGTVSDYMGIDNVVYTPYVCPTITLTAGGALSDGIAGTAYSSTLTQTGALGATNFEVTAGALPTGLTISSNGTISGTPTASGTFNFDVTMTDASACSGSESYSITIDCPSNPIAINTLNLCDNSPVYTLDVASPTGGTYSGTGVTGDQFDPAAGTQTITYDYIDPYGCEHNATTTITVNALPTVTLESFTSVCNNQGAVTLTGGLPAGGSYSGTGVTGTGTQFNPTVGTQAITYTYTDENGCANEATKTITVNNAPTATFTLATNLVCLYSDPITLTTGLPTGGIYEGTGVSNDTFSPEIATVGTHTLSYIVTENGCTDTAYVSIEVDACASILNTTLNTLNVYPNPTTGSIQIELNKDMLNNLTIEIINLDGKVVYTETVNENTNQLKSISMTHLSKGSYLLQVRSAGQSYVQRVVLN